jgi:hypothetical protein
MTVETEVIDLDRSGRRMIAWVAILLLGWSGAAGVAVWLMAGRCPP